MVIDYCRSDIFDQYRGRLCQRTAQIGISLLATVLSIVLVMFLAPYVSDALIKWTPADEMIEEKCMEMFMPQISADTLKNADLSGTSLGELNQDQLADINNPDWNQLGINIQDILISLERFQKKCRFRRLKMQRCRSF